ncbi:PecA family PE domain-processing aspartic protease [Mycolicibacterium sp. Dal123E01]|uniref:PecA family PE domain-processing aspartic protease n=1 Tax=Mycolicibacterium sp. Dal123E01 TaxID=3457578 RepID=UPI00403E3BE6
MARYGWLGAAAVTIGIGAALATGAAMANADSGAARHTSNSAGAKSDSSRVAIGHGGPRKSGTPLLRRLTTTVPSTAGNAQISPFNVRAAVQPSDTVSQPGRAVTSALQQISDAQAALRDGTWGGGNIAGGLVSLVPQALLAQASWSLTTWQNSIAAAQAAVADTDGVPVAHQLAQLSLLGTLLLPSVAEAALEGAKLTIPVVSLFAPEAAAVASNLVAQARPNARVYGVVPFYLYGGNEIAYISVNGGPRVPVVLDTGSSGLSITRQYAGTLGEPTGGPYPGAYGVSDVYSYYTYKATVDFGNGIVTDSATINVVDLETQQNYNNYQYADGVVGVLGIGLEPTAGPPPNGSLPGELKNGVLTYRFGSFGLMVFGPNPLPVRASLPGVANTYTQVRINDGPPTLVKTLIDSGGQKGVIPSSLIGTGQTSGSVSIGTRIAVYTADGQTLLYSYTTTRSNAATVDTGDLFITGYIPFELGPIYLDYSVPGGIGSTKFDYL